MEGASAPEMVGAIHAATGVFVTAVSTDVAAVRANGIPIECAKFPDAENGNVRNCYYAHRIGKPCHCQPSGEPKTMIGIYGDTIEAHYSRTGEMKDYRRWLRGGKEREYANRKRADR
jgi:hypothetical protein